MKIQIRFLRIGGVGSRAALSALLLGLVILSCGGQTLYGGGLNGAPPGKTVGFCCTSLGKCPITGKPPAVLDGPCYCTDGTAPVFGSGCI